MSENYRSTQESLLQSYRSLFVSSQSFILAVGTIGLTTDYKQVLLPVLSTLSLLMIWYMWVPIVISRARFVDFYKLQSNDKFRDAVLGKQAKDYVQDCKFRKEANRAANETNWGPTRYKIDIGIPVIFSFVWILLCSMALTAQ